MNKRNLRLIGCAVFKMGDTLSKGIRLEQAIIKSVAQLELLSNSLTMDEVGRDLQIDYLNAVIKNLKKELEE